MNNLTPIVAALALTLAACEKSPEAPQPTPGVPPVSDAPTPAAPETPAYEPTYTLEFVTPEGADAPTGVQWTALVNTGGWTMTTESVLVEPPQYGEGMNVRIYAILERPGAGETVTQALETLTGTHDAAQPITHAELSIKLKGRDDPADWQRYYAVVKTIKAE